MNSTGPASAAVAETLLASIQETNRDRLFKLLDRGPHVVEELIGERPHRSKLFRHYRNGQRGEFIQTVTIGRTLYTTRRWLIEFWAAVDAARRADNAPAPAKARRKNRRRKVRSTR